jgi:hypothetical protein
MCIDGIVIHKWIFAFEHKNSFLLFTSYYRSISHDRLNKFKENDEYI